MAADDHQLALRCRDGQDEACNLLLTRYEGYIYSLCHRLTNNREDSLELAQESMLRIITGLDTYQLNRPFKPWLRRVVINVCLNFLRGKEPETFSLDAGNGEKYTLSGTLTGKNDSDPAAIIELIEIRDAVKIALQRLPPPLRLVLVLRHQEDMSYEEIASSTGMPVGTVKTRLFRGRRLLREALGKTYGWEVTQS